LKLVLASEAAARDEAGDQTLPIRLRKLTWRLHRASILIQGFSEPAPGKQRNMLRKLLWSGLYAGIAAGTAMASQRVAHFVWRRATGDDPPEKK
jgi:hypothetical protein